MLLAALGIAQAQVGFPDMGKAKAAITNVFPIIDRCGGGQGCSTWVLN